MQLLYRFIHRHIGGVAVGDDHEPAIFLFFQHSVRAGVAVITPRVLLAVTLTIFAPLHIAISGFRVVIGIGHACAELDK